MTPRSLVMVVLSHGSARERWAQIRERIGRDKKRTKARGGQPEEPFMESLRGIDLELLASKREEPGSIPSWSKHEALRSWLPSASTASIAPPLKKHHGAGGCGGRIIPELQRLREALIEQFGSLELAFAAADFFPSKMISLVELEEFICSELRCGLGRHEVGRIFRALDRNKDGRVSRAELIGLGEAEGEEEPCLFDGGSSDDDLLS